MKVPRFVAQECLLLFETMASTRLRTREYPSRFLTVDTIRFTAREYLPRFAAQECPSRFLTVESTRLVPRECPRFRAQECPLNVEYFSHTLDSQMNLPDFLPLESPSLLLNIEGPPRTHGGRSPLPPRLLALEAPPGLLALEAPPRLLALEAPPRLLALEAPPRLLALEAPAQFIIGILCFSTPERPSRLLFSDFRLLLPFLDGRPLLPALVDRPISLYFINRQALLTSYSEKISSNLQERRNFEEQDPSEHIAIFPSEQTDVVAVRPRKLMEDDAKKHKQQATLDSVRPDASFKVSEDQKDENYGNQDVHDPAVPVFSDSKKLMKELNFGEMKAANLELDQIARLEMGPGGNPEMGPEGDSEIEGSFPILQAKVQSVSEEIIDIPEELEEAYNAEIPNNGESPPIPCNVRCRSGEIATMEEMERERQKDTRRALTSVFLFFLIIIIIAIGIHSKEDD